MEVVGPNQSRSEKTGSIALFMQEFSRCENLWRVISTLMVNIREFSP
ncbi:hypothetical protein HMPREF0880_02715 [Yokenella regensburgei ATCC 43003]|nr:hypothetical protein HMPREF0880_02715 [Yokenella regensburgei ATCC 43003]